jgi:hypothetical protein
MRHWTTSFQSVDTGYEDGDLRRLRQPPSPGEEAREIRPAFFETHSSHNFGHRLKHLNDRSVFAAAC